MYQTYKQSRVVADTQIFDNGGLVKQVIVTGDANPTEVEFRDGAAGDIYFSVSVPAGETVSIEFAGGGYVVDASSEFYVDVDAATKAVTVLYEG